MIIAGTYVGIRNRLKNKTALLQAKRNGWIAQFDDRTLKEAFGWHWFPKTAFRVHNREDWS